MLSAEAIEYIANLGKMVAPPTTLPDGGIVVFGPNGEPQAFPPLEKPLTHVKARVNLHDADSFIAYVNRFKTPETQLFAEPGFMNTAHAATIAAIIDYHKPAGIPDWASHAAVYRPRYSDQWQVWTHTKPLGQLEFAIFLEENRGDIVKPDAAALLDLVRTFKASKKAEFDSLVYQPNGDAMIAYSEKTEQKGGAYPMPAELGLGIPVYFRDVLYAVPILLRYQIVGGKLMFSLKADRANVIEDEAFSTIVGKIAAGTEIATYLGAEPSVAY